MKVVAHEGLYGHGKKLGSDLLFHSILHGDVQNVVNLIEEEEADVNSSNINKETALHFAVQAGSHKLVEILLQEGANSNL